MLQNYTFKNGYNATFYLYFTTVNQSVDVEISQEAISIVQAKGNPDLDQDIHILLLLFLNIHQIKV